jgi:hypothetical protein
VLFGEIFSQLSVISVKNRQISVLKNYWKILTAGDISILTGDICFNNGGRCEKASSQVRTRINNCPGRDDAIIKDGPSTNLRANTDRSSTSKNGCGINNCRG